MRDAENIRQVEALGIDWMGFIFWPKSKRYVSQRPAYLPTRCKRVGVFVDADIEQVRRTAEDYALDIIQLHGSESPEYLRQLHVQRSTFNVQRSPFNVHRPPFNVQRSTSNVHRPIIKAFNIATKDDLEATKPYEGIVDYFLFDTKGKSVGGNGEKFDWSVLADYIGETPFLLSGGIGPDDANRVKAFHHPQCIGIDLNSRFEVEPAYKDIKKLKTFLEQL